jgi:hypothetical protein
MPPLPRRFALILVVLAPLVTCAPATVAPTSAPNMVALPHAERVVVAPFSGSEAAALRQALIERLRARGLTASAGDVAAAGDRSLLVQGQLATPFGGVTAEVQLLYVLGHAAPQFLESFQVDTGTPNLAVGPTRARLAEAIAGRIVDFAAARGWR